MGQYFTDFSEAISSVDKTLDVSEVGAFFSVASPLEYGFPLYNLVEAWDKIGSWGIGFDLGGERVIRVSWNQDGRKGLLWYDPGVFADVVATVQVNLLTGATTRPGILLRASGEATKENGYGFYIRTVTNILEIGKYVAGTFTSLTTTAFTATRDVWYNIKAECSGTTVRMKVWLVGNEEPAGWSLSTTDSAITKGYCGLFSFDGGATYFGRAYFKTLRVVGTPLTQANWFHGWTRPVGNCIPYIEAEAGATGGKVLKVLNPTGTSARKFYAWVDVEADDITEVVCKVKVSTRSNAIHLLRIGSGVTTESGYFLRLYDSSGGIILTKYITGTPTDLDNTTLDDFAISANSYFWLRLLYNRSTKAVKAKVWLDGNAEPGDWQIEQNADADYDAIGFVGIGSFAATGDTQTYDLIGVGTGGDSAPKVAPE